MSCIIDTDSVDRIGAIGKNNLPQNLPALPIISGSFLHSQGNPLTEDQIRPMQERTKKTCNPTDYHFYDRSFSIFEGLSIKPNACVDNIVFPQFQGEDTRRSLKTEYRRNGCKK